MSKKMAVTVTSRGLEDLFSLIMIHGLCLHDNFVDARHVDYFEVGKINDVDNVQEDIGHHLTIIHFLLLHLFHLVVLDRHRVLRFLQVVDCHGLLGDRDDLVVDLEMLQFSL